MTLIQNVISDMYICMPCHFSRTEYVKASGPNVEYRQGPDPSRVQGSQGALGRDLTLACGPQSQLVHGSGGQIPVSMHVGTAL